MAKNKELELVEKKWNYLSRLAHRYGLEEPHHRQVWSLRLELKRSVPDFNVLIDSMTADFTEYRRFIGSGILANIDSRKKTLTQTKKNLDENPSQEKFDEYMALRNATVEGEAEFQELCNRLGLTDSDIATDTKLLQEFADLESDLKDGYEAAEQEKEKRHKAFLAWENGWKKQGLLAPELDNQGRLLLQLFNAASENFTAIKEKMKRFNFLKGRPLFTGVPDHCPEPVGTVYGAGFGLMPGSEHCVR